MSSDEESNKKLTGCEYLQYFYHFVFLCADITSDLLFCYQLHDAKESEARSIFWILVGILCFSSFTYSLQFVVFVMYNVDNLGKFTFCKCLTDEKSQCIGPSKFFLCVILFAPFGQLLPVVSVCIAFYNLHMEDMEDVSKEEIEATINGPFYLELFSETILQSVVQFYVIISFSEVSIVQYLSFTISLVNLCSKLWAIFSVSKDEKWQIVMLAVGTWLSVDVLLEFTNLWAFMNLTSGSYHLLGFDHMTIWTVLYYVKVGIIYLLMSFCCLCYSLKEAPDFCMGLFSSIMVLFLTILLVPLGFTVILVLKFSLIVPVLTLSLLWFKVRYYQLREHVDKCTEKKLPFLFLVRYSLQSFLPNGSDTLGSLFIELYLSKVYQRPKSEVYQKPRSKRTLNSLLEKEEKCDCDCDCDCDCICIFNVLFYLTLVLLGIAFVIQIGSAIYSLFHLVNALLKGVGPESIWYVGSLTSMLVVSLVIGVLFTKIMKQKIPKFAALDEDNLEAIFHFLISIDKIQSWQKDFESKCNSKKMLSLEKVTGLPLKTNTTTTNLHDPNDDSESASDSNKMLLLDKVTEVGIKTTTTNILHDPNDNFESKCNYENTTTTTTSTITLINDVKKAFTEEEYVMWKVDQEQWGALDCCKQCGDNTKKYLNRCYGCRCCFCHRCYHALHNKIQGCEEHKKERVTDAINPSNFKEKKEFNWVRLAMAIIDPKFNIKNKKNNRILRFI